jgi:hypothetical protein
MRIERSCSNHMAFIASGRASSLPTAGEYCSVRSAPRGPSAPTSTIKRDGHDRTTLHSGTKLCNRCALEEHAVAIVNTVKDYRAGEISPIGVEHVLKWVGQFPAPDRPIILSELNHILAQTYVNQTEAKSFLSNLSKSSNLTGRDQKDFWKNTTLLEIQKNGHSQKEMNKLFES